MAFSLSQLQPALKRDHAARPVREPVREIDGLARRLRDACAERREQLLDVLALIYVDGGNVIRQFLAAHLIDDLTISVVPIVLGGGIRLFAGDEGEHALVLEDSES